MKVVLEAQYAWSPHPRGLHLYAIQMIRSLLKRKVYNYELTFFDFNRECNNRIRIEEHFGEFKIPIHECNTLDYRTARSDRDIYREKSYNDYTGAYGDVFHFFHLITIPDNLEGKMIVTVHDFIPVLYPELCLPQVNETFQVGLERLKRVKPTIISDSEATKNDILRFTDIPPNNIFVIPLAYDREKCTPKKEPLILRQMGIDSPFLLYLGGVGGHKNVERIAKAFEYVAENISDIKLVIAGNAETHAIEEIKKIKSSAYFESRILMPGYVTEEQKYALYSGALAFVFPTLYEGFGLPVLEAMACGSPVITSNVSSLPEVAGNAAILVDPYNVEQLAYEMERVITSESLREELRLKGFEQAQRFSWDKAAEQVESVYQKIMEN